ncbi:hypothetical protein GCM10007380_24510 [Gottfriedia solisilvae]|uniref:Uncharacterized protein n=1 Tax=Gottfriedia solisilvae TaxID=1516104 RepID=A0A8J3EZ97_9BACI|nr:hypothetical protein GCM10007380_24510 [Gottfriedia solisilvae]
MNPKLGSNPRTFKNNGLYLKLLYEIRIAQLKMIINSNYIFSFINLLFYRN